MRWPRSLKPDTCTERYDVDPTGISRKVARITLGGPSACLVLPALQGAGMGWRESAEAILAARNRSGEGPNLTGVDSHACSLNGQDSKSPDGEPTAKGGAGSSADMMAVSADRQAT